MNCDKWISFNAAISYKGDKSITGVHFFIDDYQFERVWIYPDRYCDVLKDFAVVLAPDFSTYSDMPLALQIYNHYRKHWFAAYMQSKGIQVIPTISWSDEDSYEWCFDGEPTNSIVAISSVGCMKNKVEKAMFYAGVDRMIEKLNPKLILCYGNIDDVYNTIKIKPYYEDIKEKRNKHGR